MEWTRGRREFGSSPTGIFLRVGNVADNFSSEVNMAIRWVCVYLLCLATCQLCISSSQFSPNSGEWIFSNHFANFDPTLDTLVTLSATKPNWFVSRLTFEWTVN
jgi:hypothetical protein